MKLKPRTTYETNGGEIVRIAGVTKYRETCEDQLLYWSIRGDWYAEDGRAITYDRNYDRTLLPRDARSSLKAEVDTPEARSWWFGVVTANQNGVT